MTESEYLALVERVDALESQIAIFGAIDPELAVSMLTFWCVVFVTAHGAGRVVRWLGKA